MVVGGGGNGKENTPYPKHRIQHCRNSEQMIKNFSEKRILSPGEWASPTMAGNPISHLVVRFSYVFSSIIRNFLEEVEEMGVYKWRPKMRAL